MFWVFFWSLAHLHFFTFYPKDWCFIIIYALDLKSFLYRLRTFTFVFSSRRWYDLWIRIWKQAWGGVQSQCTVL